MIGFLRSTPLADVAYLVTAFRQGLKETGYIDGKNVAIVFRSAEDVLDRLPALVTELISRPVAVIVTNNDATLAAKTATTTVPIVFATGGDPVSEGLVASLNRPGGNVTGRGLFQQCARREATGIAAPACTQSDNNWHAGEPKRF